MAFSFWAWLGRVPAMCEAVWLGVREPEQFARAAFGRRGGWSGFSGVCAGGVCGQLGGVGLPWGVGLPSVGVCGLSSVGGGEGCPAGGSVAGVCCCLGRWGKPVSRVPGPRAMVGVCGSPGGQRVGGGMGGDCAVGCCVGVCVRSQRRACVVSCRPGGLEEKHAVFCCRGKDFADELAYLVDLLVSGGKGVC